MARLLYSRSGSLDELDAYASEIIQVGPEDLSFFSPATGNDAYAHREGRIYKLPTLSQSSCGAEPMACEASLAVSKEASGHDLFRVVPEISHALTADLKEDEVRRLKQWLDSGGVFTECSGFIDGNGHIVVVKGLLIVLSAVIRGVPKLPVRILWRHRHWLRLRKELVAIVKVQGRLYQRVLHPDLEGFPAVQPCTDRISLVEKHLPKGCGTALDLGACYGTFSRYLEQKGYRVVAVESDPCSVHVLSLVTSVFGSKVEIFPHDVRKYEPRDRIDILWATSVLHFFNKTRKDHESLRGLLQRLSPRYIVFEPPREEEYAKSGFYINYEPQAFANAVCSWAGLSRCETLGCSVTGRPVYLLSK